MANIAPKLSPELTAWTKKDVAYLKKNYETCNLAKMCNVLNRTVDAVRAKAYVLGLKRQVFSELEPWGETDIAYLSANYPTGSLVAIAEHLNRTLSSIRGKAFDLGLKRSGRYWNAGDEKWLLDNWAVMTAVELGNELGKTKWAVINKHGELTGRRKGHKKLKV